MKTARSPPTAKTGPFPKPGANFAESCRPVASLHDPALAGSRGRRNTAHASDGALDVGVDAVGTTDRDMDGDGIGDEQPTTSAPATTYAANPGLSGFLRALKGEALHLRSDILRSAAIAAGASTATPAHV